MNRKEKIETLKAISEGRKSIKSLKAGLLYFVVHDAEMTTFKIDNFIEGESERVLNRVQFEAFKIKLDEHNRELPNGSKNVLVLFEETKQY